MAVAFPRVLESWPSPAAHPLTSRPHISTKHSDTSSAMVLKAEAYEVQRFRRQNVLVAGTGDNQRPGEGNPVHTQVHQPHTVP